MSHGTAVSHARSGRRAFDLRPGVRLPDWAAVTSPQAEQALLSLLDVFSFEKCFSDYDATEDQVRQALIRLYGELGCPPTFTELAEATDISEPTVASALSDLRARDLVVLNQSDGEIVGAYPLTERNTGHVVKLGKHTLNAMCAVDALGVGAMYGRDVGIESACRNCGARISIHTRDGGTGLGLVAPVDAVVWNGIFYEGQAANSLCTVISFFCSDAHLDDWKQEGAGHKGYRLTIDEAMQVGRAVFGPMLAQPEAPEFIDAVENGPA